MHEGENEDGDRHGTNLSRVEMADTCAQIDEAERQIRLLLFGQKGKPDFREKFRSAMAVPDLGFKARLALMYALTPEEEEAERRRESPSPELLAAYAVRDDAWNRLYSRAFWDAVEALKQGDPAGIETAIAYIEADPWHFRSGYTKQNLARYLRKHALTTEQADRLRAAIIVALGKGRRGDLEQYARLSKYLDTPEFRVALETLAREADESTRWRAEQVLAKCRYNDRQK